jgi:CRISPR-associated protein Cas5d
MSKFQLKVWGDNACFTRPEMKSERVSYDVITPSAARGIFEAILWKPAIRWKIERIDVLNPIRYESVRRNELGSKIPLGGGSGLYAAMSRNENKQVGFAQYIEEDRQQRASLLLREPAYVLHASFSLTDRAGKSDNKQKFAEMFQRRVERGQCFHMPAFGCREFPAFFEMAGPGETPIPVSQDLGWMLYDLDFAEPEDPRPLFFRAQMKQGVIRVPARTSDGVRG